MVRRAEWLVLAVALVFAPCARVHTRAEDNGPSRRERFLAIKAKFDSDLSAYRTAASQAKTDAERDAAEKARPSLNVFGKRILILAEERPADEVARDSLLWIAGNYARREKLELDSALDLLEKHHLKAPELKSVVPELADGNTPRARALAETLAEKAGDREVRGLACLFLGYTAFARGGGQGVETQAQVERWMARVKKDYADLRFGHRTLGDLADGQIFEMRNLVPGKVVPQLEGAAVDGTKVRLNDFRGKVVLLVFWGSWCGPCMAEVAHFRELSAKLAERPFAVVGVNCGDTKQAAAKAVQDHKMTWPVLFDGENGPIALKWNTVNFPTIYVIDAAGVIRYKDGPGEFDAAVETLVREAERKR